MNRRKYLIVALLAVLVLLAVVALFGKRESRATIAEIHDGQIEAGWMVDREQVDAVTFLEEGGVYENKPEKADVDRTYLLPLLKQLKDDFELSPVALLDEPRIAFAVVIDVSGLSAEDGQRSGVVDAIQAADDAFPGLLVDKWGGRWLSLDLFDEQDLEVFPEKTRKKFERLVVEDREANRG